VVGDSISCGYGVLGSDATCTATPANEDHDDSYGAIAARQLGAELFTISASGYGMYEDDTGNTSNTLPSLYGSTLPFGAAASAAWSFSTWIPDFVVIDLGTNDFAGSNGDPGQPFVTAYTTFLRRVRQNYPGATIVCTNGPMLTGSEATLAESYIQSAISMTEDPKVVFMAFETQSQSAADQGCDGHPNVATQQAMATQLTSFLTPLLWE
jgi:lysophospholipase L1-like esterase